MIDTLQISRNLRKDSLLDVEQAERIARAVATAADDRDRRLCSLDVQMGVQTGVQIGVLVMLTAFFGATFWQVQTGKDRLAETQVVIEAKLSAAQVASGARFTRIETRLERIEARQDGMKRTLNAIAAKLGETP